VSAPKPRPVMPVRIGPEDTKMQRDRMQAEHRQELLEREGEIAMVSKVDAADAERGIYDPITGDLIESALTDEEHEALARQHHLRPDEDGVIDPFANPNPIKPPAVEGAVGPNGVPIYSAEEDPDLIHDTSQELVPDVVPVGAGGRPSKVAVSVARNEPMEVIRLNATIEPTIGQGNTIKFEEGKRYRVPRYIAQHLHEKGYISQWG
jgi:hypothetical protein